MNLGLTLSSTVWFSTSTIGPKYGLKVLLRTDRNSTGLFQHVRIFMGDLAEFGSSWPQ